MIIRLYTEDKARPTIMTIVGQYFDGFTLIPCTGIWKGIPENGLVVEIVSEEPWAEGVAEEIAREIKQANQQEAVLVSVQKNVHYLI